MRLDVVHLTASHNVLPFECGEAVLDRHLKESARKQAEDCTAITYVAVDSAEPATVRGFYSLQASELNLGTKPPGVKKLKGQSMPIVIVNYFGVHEALHRQRIGETMLLDLYRRVQTVSEIVGCHAVYLEAISDEIVAFYARYSMKPYGQGGRKLWIPVSTIRSYNLI